MSSSKVSTVVLISSAIKLAHSALTSVVSRLLLVKRIACAALLLLVLSPATYAQITDWQKPDPYRGESEEAPSALKDDDYQLPGISVASGWIEFYVGSETRNRYYVARDSLFIGKDLVTRFVSRVLTPGGAENISVEAIRCATAERRSYAYMRGGREWVRSRDVRWHLLSDGNRLNAYQVALYDGLLCSGDQPMKPADSIEAFARSFKSRTGTPLTGYR